VQILDQYLAFITPSPSLFSLLPPNNALAAAPGTPGSSSPNSTDSLCTYAILNSPSSSEQDIEAEIERIATGLFSVVATMGTSTEDGGVLVLSWL
jgi:sec1 family domain-containing protein 1